MPHILREFVSAHPPSSLSPWLLLLGILFGFFIALQPLLNDNFRPELNCGKEEGRKRGQFISVIA